MDFKKIWSQDNQESAPQKKKLNKEHEHRYAASATCVRTILFKVAKAQGMRF